MLELQTDCSEIPYIPPPTSVRVMRSLSFDRTDFCRIRSYWIHAGQLVIRR